jgi:hypothetical protein
MQALPVVGALGCAAVNYAFIARFQDVARGHFTVRDQPVPTLPFGPFDLKDVGSLNVRAFGRIALAGSWSGNAIRWPVRFQRWVISLTAHLQPLLRATAMSFSKIGIRTNDRKRFYIATSTH